MEKSLKKEINSILSRMMEAVGAKNDLQLGKILNYKSTSTVSGWRAAGEIPDGAFTRASRISGKSYEHLRYGKQLSVVESTPEYTSTNSRSPHIEKVAQMMADMDEDMQKDICLSVEKEKLLRDLLRQKELDEKAS